MAQTFYFGDRPIGAGEPVFCIAELSGNHGGSLERARDMVHAAADSGADAVKVQTFTADSITLDSDAPPFQARGLWEGRTLYDLYSEGAMPWEWQAELAELADDVGIKFFSSVFDPTSIEFLEGIGVEAYKIASFEIVDIPLIEQTAATGKPIIISTGMATLAEIDEAVRAAQQGGAQAVAVLACTSSYPAPASDANLLRIPHLADAFGVAAGLSDHTLGSEVAIAATALGATVIEKHFILRRSDGGVDSAFSLEPQEFAAMVDGVRNAQAATGRVTYGPTEADEGNLKYRRSLYVARDVAAGSTIGDGDVRSVRPAGGLHPRHLHEVIGGIATRALSAGEPMSWDLVQIGK